MKRRELREHIFRLLFRVEFNNSEELQEQEDWYLEDLPMASEKDQVYISDKFHAILAKLDEIDHALEQVSSGWKVSRMGKVELTIMRLAAYEILFDEEVPNSVAINEAVELAKIFAGDESPAFINGVLGKLVKE